MGDAERTVSIIIKAKDEAGSTIENFVKSLGSIQGVALLATAAVAGAAYAFAKFADAAAEQEDADVRLAAALHSIGQNSAEARQHLSAFAGQLEQQTGVSKGAIESAAGLIAQLGQLSGGALEDATRSALDLSVALGTDLQSAAMMVARASEGNETAFKRFGIVIDETIPKSQRAAAIMKELHDRFGGMAEVMAGTLTGAFRQIGNAFDNLEQALGKEIVENDTFRALLGIVKDLLKDTTEWVEKNSTAIGTLTTWLSRATVWVIQFGVESVNSAARSVQAWTTLTEFILAFVAKAVTSAPKSILKLLGIDPEDVLDAAGKIAGLAKIIEQIRADAAGMGDATDKMLADIQHRLETIGKAGHDVAKDLGQGVGPAKEQLSALDQILKDLGGETMVQLQREAAQVDEALKLLVSDLAAGKITPEQYDHILETITQITQKLPQWTEDQRAALVPIVRTRDAWAEIADTIQTEATQSALRFSDALIETAYGAKTAWGQFFKSLAVWFTEAIAKALLLRLISAGFSSFFGGSDASAAASAGAGEDFGIYPDAAKLGISPAQVFTPSSLRASSTQPGAGPSTGGPLQMFNQIVPLRNRESEIADLLDDMNRAVERRGYRLVASHVIG